VVDLSSSLNEEGLILDTSRDEEYARRLFGDLNHNVLGPSGDGKVIILSDSDEELVHEEDAVDSDAAPFSTVKSPAPTASTADTDEDLKGLQDDNSDGLAPYRERGDGSYGGDKAGSP
jgi:hypothetical protein